MTAVVLSRKLTLLLQKNVGPSEPSVFATRFQQWRDSELMAGEVFGKNSAFIKPRSVVEAGLWKVHMETPETKRKWDRLADKGEDDPNAYTSDKILVYARLSDLKYQPFMPLLILHPGHAFMQNPELVGRLADFYEDERYDFVRRLASEPWVTVGFP